VFELLKYKAFSSFSLTSIIQYLIPTHLQGARPSVTSQSLSFSMLSYFGPTYLFHTYALDIFYFITNLRPVIHGHHPVHPRAHRIGGWLPRDPHAIRYHVNNVVRRAMTANLPMAKPVQDLQNLINSNPIVHMLFSKMLVEVPLTGKYNLDPSLQHKIRDVPTVLQVINYQIQSPISYNDSPQIGIPINAILDWPMGTKAGFAAFLQYNVNEVFRRILQYWGAFLQSPAFLETITTKNGEWLSTIAQSDPQSPGLKIFIKTYICDPIHPHYSFTSWDNFFLRKYRPQTTPCLSP
jgi:phosphatidylserine decarboxylase